MGIKDIGLTGLTWSSMKKHYAIIPMYGLSILGMGWAGYYVYRLATKSPEVTWSTKNNPEPWNEYSFKQYKFVGSGRDYTKGTPAPKYK